MTVIENVALPLAYKGITNVRRLHRSSELLEKIGLKTREYYFPRQLSGGQLQRVAIARALINKPSILIADEPTGNLDSASNKVVMNLLRDIHKGGNTIIMVTHNVELTAYASRVVYMIDGHIHQDKPLRENETADIFKLHNAPSIDKTKRGQKKSKVKK
jgi:putative ABC transport system ATP-binding protein